MWEFYLVSILHLPSASNRYLFNKELSSFRLWHSGSLCFSLCVRNVPVLSMKFVSVFLCMCYQVSRCRKWIMIYPASLNLEIYQVRTHETKHTQTHLHSGETLSSCWRCSLLHLYHQLFGNWVGGRILSCINCNMIKSDFLIFLFVF